jgi:orotidine-5'-phosphate decarboxylase
VAFFERFGSEGYRVLERLISDARDADVLVVADAKRGDFAATNAGYAEAWLAERSPLRVDAVTASPYLGVEALAPLFAHAHDNSRGVFVLVATSNPEGRALQRARTTEGERVEDLVLRSVAELNKRDDGLGSFGVVIGATRDAPEFDLAHLGGPYLVPGVGAQGASAEDVARLFARCPKDTVLVNVARSILNAGPERAALRDAARRWRDDLNQALA